MKLTDTAFPDIKLVELHAFHDPRGYFLESWRQDRYGLLQGLDGPFVQDNFSLSRLGVLRGLHFQTQQPQGKLIQVLHGDIYDVVVDVRGSSPFFGKWIGLRLEAARCQQLWVPPGFAHGFLTLSAEAAISYKCTDYYHPESEACLLWNDPDLAIDWPQDNPILSFKDAHGATLRALAEAGKVLS